MTQARTTSAEQLLPLVVAMHRLLRGLRRSAGAHSVPPTQLIVLALLREHGPLRIGTLATLIPCAQPTATTAVATMQHNGLVDRIPDTADGRATRVVATDRGLHMLRSIALGEADMLARLLDTLPAHDHNAFTSAAVVLTRLADASSQPVAPPA